MFCERWSARESGFCARDRSRCGPRAERKRGLEPSATDARASEPSQARGRCVPGPCAQLIGVRAACRSRASYRTTARRRAARTHAPATRSARAPRAVSVSATDAKGRYWCGSQGPLDEQPEVAERTTCHSGQDASRATDPAMARNTAVRCIRSRSLLVVAGISQLARSLPHLDALGPP